MRFHFVERRKRRIEPFHLIRAESNRDGESDRCVRDEISSNERVKPRQLPEYKFRAIASC